MDRKPVIIFAGTTEGRTISEYLASCKVPVTACVATEYGETLLTENEYLKVHAGRMDQEEIAAFIREKGAELVIDATHPYAAVVSENVAAACEREQVDYVRLIRGSSAESVDQAVLVGSVDEAAKRIYATTDKARGALKHVADEEGYETFVVPDDVGGRFSVLTAVGLLPIAVSGADITKLMEGAASGRELALNTPFEENDAVKYAVIRNILHQKGKAVEVLANYEPSLHYVSEWWKQLYGESEGKDQKGIFPASVDLTADLHSMGQFIQDGSRIMYETVLEVENCEDEIVMSEEAVDLDGLNYLAGKNVDFVNKSAMNGTILAHTDGNVPNLLVKIPAQDEFSLGQLFYFFEFACGVSGYMLGVNPFNQPGVESYKKNMFALLGKPGYEAQREELLKRL